MTVASSLSRLPTRRPARAPTAAAPAPPAAMAVWSRQGDGWPAVQHEARAGNEGDTQTYAKRVSGGVEMVPYRAQTALSVAAESPSAVGRGPRAGPACIRCSIELPRA